MQNAYGKISRYLHDLSKNGDVIRLTNNTLTLMYADNIFDSTVMRNHRFGEIEYGLIQRDHIPVVLIAFGNIRYDFWINSYDLLPAKYRFRLNDYLGSVLFTLVSPTTKQVIVNRRLFFNTHFVVHLKSCLQEQWKYYHNESEVRKRIKEVAEFLTTEEMFEESKLYRCPAIKDAL